MFGKRSNEPRTAEDRARAAAERAARRGRPAALPPEAFADVVPPPDMAERGEPEIHADRSDDGRVAGEATDDPSDAQVVTAVRERPAQPRRRPPAPPRPRARRGRRRWGRRVGALIAIALIGGALYLIDAIFQPFHGDGHGAVRVTIPSGASAGKIGDILAAHGVVDNGTFFAINATLTGRRGKLRTGSYTLQRGMSNGDAITALMQGPKVRVVKSFKVTIPEGPSIREIAPLIAKTDVTGSYLKAAASKAVLKRVHKLGAPKRVKTAEGFLFPATYDMQDGDSATKLVDEQLDAFKENIRRVDLHAARRKNLTRYDVLIIASMVEREAQLPRERPLVAAVIYNRLRRGMPLGIDATIRYYTNNWQRPIRESELQANEPYNTRLRHGLPPTPIGNPGLASIRAAAHPAHRSYLFYVRKPGNSGAHAFSSTDAQFERDLQRYQASRTSK